MNLEIINDVPKCPFKIYEITSREIIFNELNILNVNKSTGVDGISQHFLKNASEGVSYSLHLNIKSFESGEIADFWRLANVYPIYIKANGSDHKNYRPISITLIF